MQKRGLQPIELEHAGTCQFGEGIIEVTHGFKSYLEVGSKKLGVDFYVMDGKSS